MSNLFLFIIFIFAILGTLLVLKKLKSNRQVEDIKQLEDSKDIRNFNDVRYNKTRLLSETEYKFFYLLMNSLPEYLIFTQVATDEILEVKSNSRSHYHSVRNRFNKTRIDFVVCTPSTEIIALVELDDQSHDDKKDDDIIRDYITAKAGYKTVRFDCRKLPDGNIIRQQILS